MSYTFYYNADGGTGTPTVGITSLKSTITIITDTPTKRGYAFLYWKTKAPTESGNSSMPEIYPGDSYTLITETTTFYAYYIKGYTVSYDANGGTTTLDYQVKIPGEPLAISSTTPTRSGYIFVGWATSRTGTKSYSAGGTYSQDVDITLYAVWEKVMSIYFNIPDGSIAKAIYINVPDGNLSAVWYKIDDTYITTSSQQTLLDSNGNYLIEEDDWLYE